MKRTHAIEFISVVFDLSLSLPWAGATTRLSAREAIDVAKPILDEMVREARTGWTRHSRLVAAYPVYTEGLDGVSYYEVKVKTGEAHSGYVLVTANRSDIEVPEIAIQGLTLNELYAQRTGRRDIRVFRYDWFRSSAKAAQSGNGQAEIVGALGFAGRSNVQLLRGDGALAASVIAFDRRYGEIVRQKGGLPYYLRGSIDDHYTEQDWHPQGRVDSANDTTIRHYLSRVFRSDGGVPVAGEFSGTTVPRPNDIAIYDPTDRTWDFDTSHDADTDATAGSWSAISDIQFAGDFDRDGKMDDLGVLRASTKQYFFDYNHNATTDASLALVGTYTQMHPVVGDFNNDGYLDDIALFSYATRKWYFDHGHDGVANTVSGPWGLAGDIPVSGDFDSDGYVDDVGVFRPSTRIWYFDYTHNGTTNDTSGPWAIDGDKPFAIDADWDGFADDVGVYRSSDGMWYFDYNRAGSTALSQGPYGPTGPYWHTPSWDQPNDTAGYPVGCGNTAWAIVYAYWQRFKSKTNLFPGVDLSRMSRAADCPFGGSISNVMWEIGRLTETEYGENDDGTYGSTLNAKMPQGISYARNQGYSSASCVRWVGGERTKWDAVDAEILADRPVILSICHDGTGSADHFVTLEATAYVSRTGSDAVGYLANFGWGENADVTLKWFFTRPTWYDPHHSVYDAYLVRF